MHACVSYKLGPGEIGVRTDEVGGLPSLWDMHCLIRNNFNFQQIKGQGCWETDLWNWAIDDGLVLRGLQTSLTFQR